MSRHHPTQTLENVSHAWPPPPTTPNLNHIAAPTYHHHHHPPTPPTTTSYHHHLTTTAATCRNSKNAITIIIVIRKETATTVSSNESISPHQLLIKSTKTGAKEVLYGLIAGLSTVRNAHHNSWDCSQHLHIEIQWQVAELSLLGSWWSHPYSAKLIVPQYALEQQP